MTESQYYALPQSYESPIKTTKPVIQLIQKKKPTQQPTQPTTNYQSNTVSIAQKRKSYTNDQPVQLGSKNAADQ